MQYTVYTYHMNMRVGPISMYVAMCIHIYITYIYIYYIYIYIYYIYIYYIYIYIYYICNIYYIYIYMLISNSVSTICPEVQPFVVTCRGLFSLEVKTCPRVGVHRVAPVNSQRPVLRLVAEPSKGGSLEVGSSSGSV